MLTLSRLSTLLLLSAAALLPACGASSLSLSIHPAGVAAGAVTGRLPIITLSNEGPEWVEATMKTADGDGFDGRLGPGSSATHKLPGPVRVRIANNGQQPAAITLAATGADGITLTLTDAERQ